MHTQVLGAIPNITKGLHTSKQVSKQTNKDKTSSVWRQMPIILVTEDEVRCEGMEG